MLALSRTALRGPALLSRRTPALAHALRPFPSPSSPGFSTLSPLLAVRPGAATQRKVDKLAQRAGASRGPAAAERGERRELDSFTLSDRIRSAFTAHDKLPVALEMLRKAPKEAATVVTWNVLLHSLFKLHPSKLPNIPQAAGGGEQWKMRKAYEVWMEMKRRKVTPSARSYGTFFGGAAKAARSLEGSKVAEGMSAEVRAKVETVWKQWGLHCERVMAAAEAGEGQGKASPAKAQGLDLDLAFEDLGEGEAGVTEDGKLDAPEHLSAHPANQYLAFLSSTLSLAIASSNPDIKASAPVVLEQLLSAFESLPLSASPGAEENPLSRTGVSYGLVFDAIKTALSAPSPEILNLPPATALLSRALLIWDDLLASPPPPSSSFPPSAPHTRPLSPILPTSLLTLFLASPNSVSALPAPLWARALSIAQASFGFVEPSRAADLAPPHPPTLERPLARLDAQGFGTAMRIAGAAGKSEWVRSWWEQARDYPERFGLKDDGKNSWERVSGRENAEVVIKAAARTRDIQGVEDILAQLSASASSKPTVATYTAAITSVSRIGNLPALDACFRFFTSLLEHSAFAGTSARGGEQKSEKAARGAVPRKEHASAAAALLRLSLGVSDRTQVWRAVKTVSGPFPPIVDEPGQYTPTSVFAPTCFPDAAPLPAAAKPRELRAQDAQLADALAKCLERLLVSNLDSFKLLAHVGEAQRKELAEWEVRLRQMAGANPSDVAGEMAQRRARLAGREGGGDNGTASGGRKYKPSTREDGQPMRRERRDLWIQKARKDWAERDVEREVFGVDARGRAPPAPSSRPSFGSARREQREREEEDAEERPARRTSRLSRDREERDDRPPRRSFRSEREDRESRGARQPAGKGSAREFRPRSDRPQRREREQDGGLERRDRRRDGREGEESKGPSWMDEMVEGK
ncbi:hypothetical protein JCM10213_003451 [Rhodosporidiobolus nylandii]